MEEGENSLKSKAVGLVCSPRDGFYKWLLGEKMKQMQQKSECPPCLFRGRLEHAPSAVSLQLNPSQWEQRDQQGKSTTDGATEHAISDKQVRGDGVRIFCDSWYPEVNLINPSWKVKLARLKISNQCFKLASFLGQAW